MMAGMNVGCKRCNGQLNWKQSGSWGNYWLRERSSRFSSRAVIGSLCGFRFVHAQSGINAANIDPHEFLSA